MLKHFKPRAMSVGFHAELPPVKMLFVAIQHLLAVFGGIVTAPLIIAMGMQLSPGDTAYLVSASLFVSGLATLLQVLRLGPIGSGLLSIQGTSFTFIGPLIFSYFTLVDGRSSAEALGMVLGTCGACALCMIVLLQFVEKLQRWITSNVSGATVILIGLSLVWVTGSNLVNEFVNSSRGFAPWKTALVAVAVFAITALLAFNGHRLLRMLSISGGLLLGFLLAWQFDMLDGAPLQNLQTFFVPSITQFPLGFDLGVFFILMPVFLISSSESLGDLSATYKLSGFTLGDADYWRRVRGGLTGDAFNSLLAALLCSFPNTTFSQNNGVIRLTGVCKPKVGVYVALLLVALGLFPIIGALFVVLPVAVLSGATLLMFMLVVVSGIEMVNGGAAAQKNWWLVAGAIALGLLSSAIAKHSDLLPQWLASLVQFPVSTGAFCALLAECIRANFKTASKPLANTQ